MPIQDLQPGGGCEQSALAQPLALQVAFQYAFAHRKIDISRYFSAQPVFATRPIPEFGHLRHASGVYVLLSTDLLVQRNTPLVLLALYTAGEIVRQIAVQDFFGGNRQPAL